MLSPPPEHELRWGRPVLQQGLRVRGDAQVRGPPGLAVVVALDERNGGPLHGQGLRARRPGLVVVEGALVPVEDVRVVPEQFLCRRPHPRDVEDHGLVAGGEEPLRDLVLAVGLAQAQPVLPPPPCKPIGPQLRHRRAEPPYQGLRAVRREQPLRLGDQQRLGGGRLEKEDSGEEGGGRGGGR